MWGAHVEGWRRWGLGTGRHCRVHRCRLAARPCVGLAGFAPAHSTGKAHAPRSHPGRSRSGLMRTSSRWRRCGPPRSGPGTQPASLRRSAPSRGLPGETPGPRLSRRTLWGGRAAKRVVGLGVRVWAASGEAVLCACAGRAPCAMAQHPLAMKTAKAFWAAHCTPSIGGGAARASAGGSGAPWWGSGEAGRPGVRRGMTAYRKRLSHG